MKRIRRAQGRVLHGGGAPGCLWDGPEHGPALGALWQDGSCHWLTEEQDHWEIPG